MSVKEIKKDESQVNNDLVIENNDLKNRVAQHLTVVKGVQAQLDATRQLFNESLNKSLTLTTQLILLQNKSAEDGETIKKLTEQLDALQIKPESKSNAA